MSSRRMLAIDLGASSGRGIIGHWDGRKITLEEIRTPAEGLKSDAEVMIENAAAEGRARLEKEEEK